MLLSCAARAQLKLMHHMTRLSEGPALQMSADRSCRKSSCLKVICIHIYTVFPAQDIHQGHPIDTSNGSLQAAAVVQLCSIHRQYTVT